MKMTRREFGLATSGAALVIVAGCGGEERALVVPEGSGLRIAVLNAKGMT